MKLAMKQYLIKLWYEQRLSAEYFAKNILKCHPSHLSAIITGKHSCGEKLAQAIEKATNGEVTKEYMMAKEVEKYDYCNLPLDGVTSRMRGE